MAAEFNVHILPYNQSGTFSCSQYDVGRTAEVTLLDEEGEYTIPSGATVTIAATKPSGYGFEEKCNWTGSTVTIVTTATMTEEAGKFPAELRVESGSTLLVSANFLFRVEKSAHQDNVTDGDAETAQELTLRVAALETSIANLSETVRDLDADTATSLAAKLDAPAGDPVGTTGQALFTNGNGATYWADVVTAPLVASAVEDMTETGRVYVYIGSESGYISGNWYYYDGSDWVSGGVYNAVAVDTSLSISGAAADAATVGDAIDDLQTDVNTLTAAVGSPLVASTVASMTDTTKVYVYTGSESGYTSGNWYYYDGSDWVSGGVYNAVAISTDTTLSVSGAAADAATVGDTIGDLEDSISDLEDSIPDLISKLDILYLYGDETEIETNWSNRDKSKMNFRYVFVHSDDKEQKYGWCKIKLQGQTSIVNPKHNFNIQFFKDYNYTTKDKMDFYDFGKHPKWTIKANYIDYSQARNIVSARLWGDMVHNRPDMRSELSDAPNHGAVDGKPVILYMNDVYYGLYTFNMPKEDWMLGLDEDDPLTIAVGAENGGATNLFTSVGVSNWTVEVPDAWTSYVDSTTGETISSQTNFLAMQDFVINSTDAEFEADLSSYFNVPSLIDYYLYSYVICNADTFEKNQLLCSWDCGQTWYYTAYDMDETFGITLTGTAAYTYDVMKENTLFRRLESLFASDIYDRYVILRDSVFSEEYMCREFELFFNLFPSGTREADKNRWPGVGNKASSDLEFFQTFIHNRLLWCDSKFESYNPDFVACTGISLDTNSLSYDALGDTYTLEATATPNDQTQSISWSSSNDAVATVSNSGTVTIVGEGECIITVSCGSYSATCTVTVDLVTVPSGYTLLTSLKVGNQAYFDTGVIPDENTGFILKYDESTTTDSTYNDRIIIANNAGTSGGYLFSTINFEGQTTWYSGGTSNAVLTKAVAVATYSVGVKTIELRNGTDVYINNAYLSTLSQGSTNPYPNHTLFAFAGRYNLDNEAVRNALWNDRTCYFLKVYDGTTLIRHYVPVKRDSDSVLGFYDVVNDTFNVAAAGAFSE